MDNQERTTKKEGRISALLPILVFLLLFMGSGIILKDFYTMPAIVAFLVALLVAILQTRGKSFNEKISIISKGIGDDNITTMCLIFLTAGGFSGAVTAAGGASSTVNLALSLMPPEILVPGLFMTGCFISISMGTYMGTISALAPIAAGISQQTGFGLPLCIGAVVSGAMFGDNLSMISDTTIAAVRTQGCHMKDKFKNNFFIVLPAAIIAIAIFAIASGSSDGSVDSHNLEYNIFQVIPYMLVLIAALLGVNVFVVLVSGIVTSVVIGIATHAMALSDIFSSIGTGVSSMYDITVISIVVAAISSLVKENGGFDYILRKIHVHLNSYRGAEFGIAGLISLIDIATANNTVAIVISGPIAKEIGSEFGIRPERSASILDIFASVFQGIIPYGAQLLSAASLTGLTSFDILPFMYYPYLMIACAIGTIIIGPKKNASKS